jgi:L-2-hydroxyglutarate oxidase
LHALGDVYDVIVVGAGIVGLASAHALLAADPSLRLCVLERHAGEARGQSGHNSGVIHSGIYYRPGSLKARLCRDGRSRLLGFCAERGVEYRIGGKLLVANGETERRRLATLEDRGRENGLNGLLRLGSAEIREFEPAVRAEAALLVPEAGVVDFRTVAHALRVDLADRGARFEFDRPLLGAQVLDDAVAVRTSAGTIAGGRLLACAGLWADEVAGRCGISTPMRVLPFRGEYWDVAPELAARIRSLIYPVPDPQLPFLGVHLTRDMDGSVEAGPNAVLALAREGYARRDVDVAHLVGLLGWPGIWKLAWRQRRYVGGEMLRSMSRRATAARLRAMVPEVRSAHLSRGKSGVRAQLVDEEGRLVDDFAFAGTGPMLHVLNAPSPAATASLAIGEHVASRLLGSA